MSTATEPPTGNPGLDDDPRALHQIGGRQADEFDRDHWSHDKVVRSTHGVKRTGVTLIALAVITGTVRLHTHDDERVLDSGQLAVVLLTVALR
ncbi:hypothetical protein [Lentzea sp. NPDC004782]|uniref:hypothetical protein n=1 Tax=Lentzea sp. NPDC004782 TaxID=3154458 RepID=UPI0033AC1535